MTKHDIAREFAKSMEFITQHSAAILFGRKSASDIIFYLMKRKDSFHKIKSSGGTAVYGYLKKKTPRFPHDFLESKVAAKYWFNMEHAPECQPRKKNAKKADFEACGMYFELDRGTEGAEGKRCINEKLERYKDGSIVIFVCTTPFSDKPENEQRRCNDILDIVDEYRKKNKCQLNCYTIPMTAYLNGEDNRPVSRKKDGNLVKNIQL